MRVGAIFFKYAKSEIHFAQKSTGQFITIRSVNFSLNDTRYDFERAICFKGFSDEVNLQYSRRPIETSGR